MYTFKQKWLVLHAADMISGNVVAGGSGQGKLKFPAIGEKMRQTFVEKVFSLKLGREVSAEDYVEVTPDVAMSHDNTAAIARRFKELGGKAVCKPDIHFIILDHTTPAPSETHAANHKAVREFVHTYGIKNFYDLNTGICHQVLPEEGFALPGTIIVGSDSHTTTYGAFGAFSTGIGRSEMAVVFATGKTWFRIPESMKIRIHGSLPQGLTGKDVILSIIGDIGADGALYQSVEFWGETVDALTIGGRMTIANMSVEMGAKNAFMAADGKLIRWLEGRARNRFEMVVPDPDANYQTEKEYDVSKLEPQIACPHTVDNVKPVSEAAGTSIHQAFVGSCTNGRLEDIAAAAGIVRGKKVHPGVRFLVYPASRNIYRDAMANGYLMDLTQAGAVIMNPGCGPCPGASGGVLTAGEVCISSSNRNFRGRMGSTQAQVYLASPASVAAAAVAGEIVDFRDL